MRAESNELLIFAWLAATGSLYSAAGSSDGVNPDLLFLSFVEVAA
jgi:hypothetical protein